MVRIDRFCASNASPAHEGTILASPVFPDCPSCPIGHAYGYLDRDGASMDAHAHPTLEYYIVLEGEGLVTIDGESRPVRPGDVVTVPRNSMHSMTCQGDRPFIWAAFWWE